MKPLISKTRALPNRFIKELTARNLRVAFAESMTCGLALHQLVKVKGTMDVLKGGIVCYDESVKTGLLKIPSSVIKKHTAESREVTEKLAQSLKKMIPADIHAAITGLAAPGGSETKRKPVGTVFFSVAFRNRYYSQRKFFRGTPMKIMKNACDELYSFILNIVATHY